MIPASRLAELRRIQEAWIPDCGDNSCRFAIHKGGMRTNGGCRCIRNEDLIVRQFFYTFNPVQVKELLDEIERLRTTTVSYDDLAEFLGKDEMRRVADWVGNKYAK